MHHALTFIQMSASPIIPPLCPFGFPLTNYFAACFSYHKFRFLCNWSQVLSSRKVQLFLGYFVRCIRIASNSETSATIKENGASEDIPLQHSYEKYFLELQPAEKGLESQILEADIVLWTVGAKPLLSQLESYNKPRELPLNARGQTETDETLRVKGHPRIFALGDSSALRDSGGKLLPATAQVSYCFNAITVSFLFVLGKTFSTLPPTLVSLSLTNIHISSQVAFQQADFAGWNLWAAINDRPLLPFRLENMLRLYFHNFVLLNHFLCTIHQLGRLV